ncbi:nitrite extrusion protein 1 [Thalassotalea insulae]|uniref:Nitrite extrusion protein 1 n=1 Tax=Thalassotalea insulae TaxID=2056778 RepID=A0ABQ6GS16_9GAMM|nr:nitrate/nitrite transporter [Thalassotalea insulae]GLX77417.1 nitrite extrusion protein 1 [Thalassotalea insulae]
MQTHHSKANIALTLATLTFAANFSVWCLYAVLGIQLKENLALSSTEFGLLLAAPMFTGAILRLPVGFLVEKYSPKKVFLIQMAVLIPPLIWLKTAESYFDYLLLGLMIGISGTSFTIGIRYVVDWFESKHQGTAMGIFGAGNAGAAITLVFAPVIIEQFGVSMVGPMYAGGMLFVILLFAFIAPQTPKYLQPSEEINWSTHFATMKELKVWRFGLYYFFVFGSFLALTMWLPQYYVAAYGLSIQQAMALTLLFVASSSLVRAIGGWFADKYGAQKVNWGVFWVCLVCLFFLSYPPTTMVIQGVEKDVNLSIEVNVWVFTFFMFTIGIAQGFGRASVYKIIYQHYPKKMGSVGGVVAMVGAFGGCTLPILFGVAVDFIGVYSACFMLLYGVLAACMLLMYLANQRENYRQRIKHAIAMNFLERD